MELQSVRALKAEIAEELIRPLLAEAREMRRFEMATRSRRRVTGVEAGIALGIARGLRAEGFRLAVRVQQRSLEADQTLRRRIEEICRREVDIRYIGEVTKRTARAGRPLPWHQTRQRPLLIGCSIGHVRVTAGTLGAFALHRAAQHLVILSNNHVLANEDKAKIGDVIIQPGAHDGGKRGRDRVGELLAFVPFEKGSANLVDAAVAQVDSGIGFDSVTLTGLGKLDGRREAMLEPGDAVAKVGRTTGATRGVVTAIELDDVVVSYERGALSFDWQIEIEGLDDMPFSAGGDSGSVIVDAEGMACGLLFAGSDQGGSNGKGLTYANDMRLVLEALDIHLTLAEFIS